MINRYIMTLLMLGLPLFLGACGQSVNGNSSYVTVGNAWNDSDALESATKWCGQFGKQPRFKMQREYRVTFDCVTQ